MLARERTTWSVVLTLLAGCTPPPPEVTHTGPTSDAMGSTGETATDAPPGPTTDGSATIGSADGTGTTMPVDDGGTTGEPSTTSDSAEGPGSSSGMMMEGTSTTGEPVACHPRLVEVFYDPQSAEDGEQWVKLYNPCAVEIELEGYSLGWGGADYTVGTLDLEGSIAPERCFIVGGPMSIDDNAFPTLDQAVNLSPDLEKSGGDADGVALFLGDAASIEASTVPVDAVIYGGSNTNGLLDANGDTPDPHVGDAGDTSSIRRTAATPTWIVEANPMPDLCPPF